MPPQRHLAIYREGSTYRAIYGENPGGASPRWSLRTFQYKGASIVPLLKTLGAQGLRPQWVFSIGLTPQQFDAVPNHLHCEAHVLFGPEHLKGKRLSVETLWSFGVQYVREVTQEVTREGLTVYDWIDEAV